MAVAVYCWVAAIVLMAGLVQSRSVAWPDGTQCYFSAGNNLNAAVKGNTSEVLLTWTSDTDIGSSSADAIVDIGIGPRAKARRYHGTLSMVITSLSKFALIKLDTNVYLRRRNYLCVNRTSLYVGHCAPLVVLNQPRVFKLTGKHGPVLEWDNDPKHTDALLRPIHQNKHPASFFLKNWIVNQGFNKTCSTLVSEYQ